MREPFFGNNAKAWAIQTIVGFAVAIAATYTVGKWVYGLSCWYITGTCR